MLARTAIVSAADADGTPLGDPPPVRQVGKRNDVLLLSGGGSVGAFGAGVLVGWSKSGTRPQFDVVTGISTGALMATLAFLGPKHDADLARAYTEITAKDVMKRHVSLVGNTALSGTNSGSIIGRSVLEMLRSIAYRSIERVYTMARNARAEYHLAYLPDDEEEPSPISFEPAALRRLFEAGRAIGAKGQWQADPPRLERYQKMAR